MTRYPHARSPRPPDVNYDESRVPAYTLPDPLIAADGSPVRSADDWFQRRRPELLTLFEREVYGRAPAPAESQIDVLPVNRDDHALSGLATRLELDVHVRPRASTRPPLILRLLLWLPNHAKTPVPAFLGLNFFGNQTVHPDPAIRLAQGWVLNSSELGITHYAANEASRGLRARRWPVEMLIARGYALTTLYGGDIDPDYHDGFENGAHGLFPSATQGERPGDAWGSLAAWSWGLSRALDALTTLERIDPHRVGVFGHSRFGKAALWAGALDPRFAWVVCNNSGHGGAALSRRRFGELTRHLNQRFPHWFAKNFSAYDDREASLPIDQHQLLALIAPRPLYVASAADDLWADPRGELLSCLEASPVYELLGFHGLRLAPGDLPLNQSLGDSIGYHCRPGAHDLLAADFWHYLNFADRHGGKP